MDYPSGQHSRVQLMFNQPVPALQGNDPSGIFITTRGHIKEKALIRIKPEILLQAISDSLLVALPGSLQVFLRQATGVLLSLGRYP